MLMRIVVTFYVPDEVADTEPSDTPQRSSGQGQGQPKVVMAPDAAVDDSNDADEEDATVEVG